MPLGAEKAGAGLLTAIGILLMVGACGKSAQIPLYIWLPDAMERSNAVSALNPCRDDGERRACIWLRARIVIFERAQMALTVVAIIGRSLHFCGDHGWCKPISRKFWPYSTVSQLGSWLWACGWEHSRRHFHLMTHAFFKGCCSLRRDGDTRGGRASRHAQDGRTCPGRSRWTFWTMTAGTLAIAGIRAGGILQQG